MSTYEEAFRRIKEATVFYYISNYIHVCMLYMREGGRVSPCEEAFRRINGALMREICFIYMESVDHI